MSEESGLGVGFVDAFWIAFAAGGTGLVRLFEYTWMEMSTEGRCLQLGEDNAFRGGLG